MVIGSSILGEEKKLRVLIYPCSL